jgi:hypothetical protein
MPVVVIQAGIANGLADAQASMAAELTLCTEDLQQQRHRIIGYG